MNIFQGKLVRKLAKVWASMKLRGVEVKLAESDDEFEQVFRLNYATYVRELGQDKDPGQPMLVDRLRDRSVYAIAKLGDKVIGMAAITLPPHEFSIESGLADSSIIADNRAQSVEVRRLAVSRDYRGKGVYVHIIDFLASYFVVNKLPYVYISALDTRVDLYRKIGFKEFDRPFTKGGCRYIPMVATTYNLGTEVADTSKLRMTQEALTEG